MNCWVDCSLPSIMIRLQLTQSQLLLELKEQTVNDTAHIISVVIWVPSSTSAVRWICGHTACARSFCYWRHYMGTPATPSKQQSCLMGKDRCRGTGCKAAGLGGHLWWCDASVTPNLLSFGGHQVVAQTSQQQPWPSQLASLVSPLPVPAGPRWLLAGDYWQWEDSGLDLQEFSISASYQSATERRSAANGGEM
jgi:hypothetical protein